MASSSAILHLPLPLLPLLLLLTSAGATVTHLHFFWHDVLTAPNATAITVTPAPDPSNAFGTTVVIDDAMTEGPDASSALVGRAQGIYVVTSQNADSALLMVMTLALSAPQYNGSTISIMGRNAVFNQVRELPVVGGTGLFRQGRGYALLKTYSFDTTTGNAVVEYDVYVTH